ncbi:hypothetical protein [Microbulbifer pacificus]|uniref:Spore coat protein U (SCPU) domain-containing protein n=1 Tax=Microbulbifer pacificus TaxID=407164 RepID=A0AAU0MYI3_9GAMM|nr:hypothetical protein [Microbulbifer pacificus]WOX04821.1 hypothetical protein R5R33_13875 [Microbulbifer pacificus]
MKNAVRVLSCGVILGLASAGTIAAVNPITPGLTSSEGSIQITLDVAQGIQIQELSNIQLDLNGLAAGNDLIGRDTFCVGAVGFKSYSIRFDSATATSGFELQGSTERLPYNVTFTSDTAENATGTATNADGTITTTYSPKSGYLCTSDAADHNAQVIVTVPTGVWEAAADPSYSDTLTVTVSGE